MKGSGIRRKKRGGNVMFSNDPKELLKKLELIIGERLAGNISIEMRNMGVALLDTLLKTFAINKSQYEKLYKKYFKIYNNVTILYIEREIVLSSYSVKTGNKREVSALTNTSGFFQISSSIDKVEHIFVYLQSQIP